jgi:uncharacterized membrane protein YedE/YeeE
VNWLYVFALIGLVAAGASALAAFVGFIAWAKLDQPASPDDYGWPRMSVLNPRACPCTG